MFMKNILLFILLQWSVFSFSQEKITLLFAGDLMQHQAQIDAAQKDSKYNYDDCFKYLEKEISKADVAIANLEVTLGGKPYAGYPVFSAPDEFLYAIKKAGFDVLITANNHCLDKGAAGLERTISILDSVKILHAGTYANESQREQNYPLLIRKNGFCIALLNYTYATNGISVEYPNLVNYIDKEVIGRDIEKARSFRPDAIIACMHWGEEYKMLPNDEQKELTDWLIACGVTHIIGSHPHVVQPMELRKNPQTFSENVVVYSLGNFISNMSAPDTDGGVLLKLELKKRNQEVRVNKCSYGLVWTSRPVLSGKKNFILLPAAIPPKDISASEANRLSIFVNNTRAFFSEYNKGINEYIF